jgi:hypothetical protein
MGTCQKLNLANVFAQEQRACLSGGASVVDQRWKKTLRNSKGLTIAIAVLHVIRSPEVGSTDILLG